MPPLLLPNPAPITDPPIAPDTISVYTPATAPTSSSASSVHSSPVANALAMSNPTIIPTVDHIKPTLHPCQLMIPEATPAPATVSTSSPSSSPHSSPISTGYITPTANSTTMLTADPYRLVISPYQPLIPKARILVFAWYYEKGFK